jgi:hypothetical protein
VAGAYAQERQEPGKPIAKVSIVGNLILMELAEARLAGRTSSTWIARPFAQFRKGKDRGADGRLRQLASPRFDEERAGVFRSEEGGEWREKKRILAPSKRKPQAIKKSKSRKGNKTSDGGQNHGGRHRAFAPCRAAVGLFGVVAAR